MKHSLRLSLVVLAAAQPAIAEDSPVYRADEVVVTATRFQEKTPAIPANVLVITKEDIRVTPAINLPDILRYKAGINVRSYFGDLSASVDIDSRGFGETGNSHVVVLLNGRRLNTIDSNAIDNWNAIPLDSIERIEIIRGSGTVLYGDNAMAGVINIVTAESRQRQTNIAVKGGSFDTYGLEAYAAGTGDTLTYNVFANTITSGGYRDNNQTDLGNLNGKMGLSMARGDAFIEFGASRLKTGLPGSVTKARFESNPSMTSTPLDWHKKESHFVRPGVQLELAPGLEFLAEVGLEDSTGKAYFQSFASYSSTRIQTLSFTPRVKTSHTVAGFPSTTAIGFDLYDSDYNSDKAGSPTGPITNVVAMNQKSRAAYLQNTTHFTDKTAATLGIRRQDVDQTISQTSPVARLQNDRGRDAYDLGVSHQVSGALRMFGKIGTTFRFAKTDDLTTWGGLGTDVRPEHGRAADIGAEWKDKTDRLQVTLYDLRLTDEIAFNTTTFRNENLDKTLHRGLEIDASRQLSSALTLTGSYGRTEAEYREGANAGKLIPLVPRDKASVGLSWRQSESTSLSVLTNFVGNRYFGSDNSNTGPLLPGYATVDMLAEWKARHWVAKLVVKNLFNRKYAEQAYQNAYYPSNPLSAYVTAQYVF